MSGLMVVIMIMGMFMYMHRPVDMTVFMAVESPAGDPPDPPDRIRQSEKYKKPGRQISPDGIYDLEPVQSDPNPNAHCSEEYGTYHMAEPAEYRHPGGFCH